jgi:hypothetical protein
MRPDTSSSNITGRAADSFTFLCELMGELCPEINVSKKFAPFIGGALRPLDSFALSANESQGWGWN